MLASRRDGCPATALSRSAAVGPAVGACGSTADCNAEPVALLATSCAPAEASDTEVPDTPVAASVARAATLDPQPPRVLGEMSGATSARVAAPAAAAASASGPCVAPVT